jgi:hypothetical protein
MRRGTSGGHGNGDRDEGGREDGTVVAEAVLLAPRRPARGDPSGVLVIVFGCSF